ncbi:MAG: hypothetical protein IPK16_17905 [Anaerolineales bacterium]|nr:hypothetical protein [Anaerolineales bacterium]
MAPHTRTGVELMSMERADAYAFHYPWLHRLVLPRAGADVALDLPHEPKQLLATTASLVAQSDLHPDLVRLLMTAVVATHRNGGRFEKPGEFPNLKMTDLPADEEAQAYMQEILRGRSFLDRYFPFWFASVLDRYLLFVIPVLLIMVPILIRGPQVFQWYMRQQVVRWYRIVQDRTSCTVHEHRGNRPRACTPGTNQAHDQRRARCHQFTMPQVYDLRVHISFVAEKLRNRRAILDQQNAAATAPG